MAQFRTFGEIAIAVTAETDIFDEDFVNSEELKYYINDEVDKCEAMIHTLGREEHYFLARRELDVKKGISEVSFPDDIYAYKIKKIIFDRGGSDYFEVRRLRGKDKYLMIEEIERYGVSPLEFYYHVLNSRPEIDPANPDRINPPEAKIMLLPTPRQDSSDTHKFKCYYIRNAQRMINEDTICDIPEFSNVIEKRVKYRVYAKEGHALMHEAKVEAEMAVQNMKDTLSTMIPDGDNTVIKDFSHYYDMSIEGDEGMEGY